MSTRIGTEQFHYHIDSFNNDDEIGDDKMIALDVQKLFNVYDSE